MESLMQDRELLVTQVIDHAARFHADSGITSCPTEGGRVYVTWSQVRERARGIAVALQGFGVKPGDRVATMAFNTHRHLEAWYGIMGIGAVCHTLNPRLFLEDLDFIANDAEDTLLLTDSTLAPIARALVARVPSIRGIIYFSGPEHLPGPEGKPSVPEYSFETLVEQSAPVLARGWEWYVPKSERIACGLCYTSGTTGRPKGVLYSHRSDILTGLTAMSSNLLGAGATDTVLAVVPLFHANSWGIAFGAPAFGAHLVLPGSALDGASLTKLMRDTRTTRTAGVPTVWLGLAQYLEETGEQLPDLVRLLVGGAACPEVIFDFFETRGVEVIHAWGMTETSPIGTSSTPKLSSANLSPQEKRRLSLRQGHPPIVIDLRIVGADGKQLPHDGVATGNIQVRGPIVLKQYYKKTEPATDKDDWFDTGDVGNISPNGFMLITDRSKDVIKSGGEWISSIEIENNAVGHPAVAEAAVIAIPHPKWTERPFLVAVLKPGRTVSKEELLNFLAAKIAKWWVPDEVAFVEELPHSATGKINKVELRKQFKGLQYDATKSKL